MHLPRRIFHSPFAPMTSICDVTWHFVSVRQAVRLLEHGLMDTPTDGTNSISLTADAGGKNKNLKVFNLLYSSVTCGLFLSRFHADLTRNNLK